jgi:hypothetical protein
MSSAELQVWVRIEDAAAGDVQNALWGDRSLVKTWAMRGTLHLVPASDFPLYVAALRTKQGWLSRAWQNYFKISPSEIESSWEAIRQALDGRCLTRDELADEVLRITGNPNFEEHLRSGWGSLLKPAAYQGYLCFGPSQGQNVTFVRPDQWIGAWEDMDPAEALQELARRYLATYGPATRDDFARWFGMQQGKEVRAVFQALTPELEEVQVDGWKAYALASTVEEMRAMPEASSVRLLPNFDPHINLNYPHRRFILDEAHNSRVYRQSAWVSPVVLVDGRIVGIWSYEKKRAGTAVTVEMFEEASAAMKAAIADEAERLGKFLASPVNLTFN